MVLCGNGHLLLGRQNLCRSNIILILGSPHCVLFCFVGHPLSNVENHWFRAMRFPIIFASFFSVIFGYCRLFSGIDFVQYFRQFRLFSSFVSRRITENFSVLQSSRITENFSVLQTSVSQKVNRGAYFFLDAKKWILLFGSPNLSITIFNGSPPFNTENTTTLKLIRDLLSQD